MTAAEQPDGPFDPPPGADREGRTQPRCPRHDYPLKPSPADLYAGRDVWRCARGYRRTGGHLVELDAALWAEPKTARGRGGGARIGGDGVSTSIHLGAHKTAVHRMAAAETGGDVSKMVRKLLNEAQTSRRRRKVYAGDDR